MGQPTWREIKTVTVPDREGSIWTPALDYITSGKLYHLVVEARPEPPAPQPQPQAQQAVQPQPAVQPPDVAPPAPPLLRDQHWRPESGVDCTADGDAALSRNGPLILDGCPAGALIAKIGGSTADVKPDQEKNTLFSVGRHCVFSITDSTKVGSLYLGMNDAKETMARIRGGLQVKIYESL